MSLVSSGLFIILALILAQSLYSCTELHAAASSSFVESDPWWPSFPAERCTFDVTPPTTCEANYM